MTKEETIHFANCLKKNYTIDFNDMEEFCDAVIKALEENTVSEEIYTDEYSRRKEAELELYKLKRLNKQKTCHNCNEDYDDCDQFVCSECGIELQDWHRVERDDDDGEISYHEYCFNFCPHCGRKIESRYEKWTKNI